MSLSKLQVGSVTSMYCMPHLSNMQSLTSSQQRTFGIQFTCSTLAKDMQEGNICRHSGDVAFKLNAFGTNTVPTAIAAMSPFPHIMTLRKMCPPQTHADSSGAIMLDPSESLESSATVM